MNYEFWIAYRYLIARKDRFLALINGVSVLGIAIGVAALIVVIGVMSGFDRDLKEKIVGTTSHMVVERETGVKDPAPLIAKIKSVKGVAAAAPFIHGNVFLEYGNRAYGLLLRGVDPSVEGTVTRINAYLKGDYAVGQLGISEIIIGRELARYYDIKPGDKLSLLSPVSGVAGEGWRYQLTVAAIFDSGMYDYDRNLILVHYLKAQEIFNLPAGTVSGVAIKLVNVDAAAQVKELVVKEIGFSYVVRTWIEQNMNFFAALKLEKFAMFVILTLIVLVASFNIISTLIVTVTTKTKDIGILRSIGVPSASIRRIFTLYGLTLGTVGTLLGLAGGMGLSYILQETQLIKLPQSVYYIDHLPVLIQATDILMITGSAILISYLATLYPASRAASLEPVEALRYQ